MSVSVAIIGGSGTGKKLAELGGVSMHVPTAAGILRGKRVEIDGRGALIISRHSAGHKTPPHAVNYRAMALGLAALGVRHCFSTAAVGSLRDDWGPGRFALCTDFLDFTGRNVTLHQRTVTHCDLSHPFGVEGRAAVDRSAARLDMPELDPAVYVCTNGPRYETPTEVRLYRQLGGDVVGMTAASEAIVMREAGVDYACLAIVTNLACGLGDGGILSHEEVLAQMDESGGRAVELLAGAMEFLP